MAQTAAQSIGERTERLALDHLRAAGLSLVARNFRCRVGELDIVMRDGQCLVFVEVRCRTARTPVRSRFPSAIESVGPKKQRKLTRAAQFFLARNKTFCDLSVRFDVIAFDGPARDEYTLQWIKDAFRPG